MRAMLAVRLSQLAAGGSGASPEVTRGLERMLRDDALPELRALGGIGTGDLAALASAVLALVGERPTTRPFSPLPPFGAQSALPFMSSNAATIARTALAVHDQRPALEEAALLLGPLSTCDPSSGQ